MFLYDACWKKIAALDNSCTISKDGELVSGGDVEPYIEQWKGEDKERRRQAYWIRKARQHGTSKPLTVAQILEESNVTVRIPLPWNVFQTCGSSSKNVSILHGMFLSIRVPLSRRISARFGFSFTSTTRNTSFSLGVVTRSPFLGTRFPMTLGFLLPCVIRI